MSTPSGFVEVRHTADWAIRAWAPDLGGLMEQCAWGMYKLLNARPMESNAHSQTRTLVVVANDIEGSLVSFLNELLYILEKDRLIANRFNFTRSDTSLLVTMEFIPSKSISKEIKGVTYHDLEIQHRSDRFETTLVFDV